MPRKGQFQPGKSGNPGGRPKEVGHIKELARKYTEAAIDALADALTDKNKRTRVAAAEALLDRGWGKATQHIEANVNMFEQMSDDEQRAIQAALEAIARDKGEDADGATPTHH